MSPKNGNKFRKNKKFIRKNDDNIIYPNDDNFIVEVTKVYNDTHFICTDLLTKTILYNARVPGRMVYKRKCIDVKPGTLILVSFRDCDSNTYKNMRNVDVIYMYNESNVEQLRFGDFIENPAKINDNFDDITFSIDDI